jgi:hypothetical protein
VENKHKMRSDVERMVAEIAQAGGIVSPESAAQAKRIYSEAGSVVAASTPGKPSTADTKTLSDGTVLTRDPVTGKYKLSVAGSAAPAPARRSGPLLPGFNPF